MCLKHNLKNPIVFSCYGSSVKWRNIPNFNGFPFLDFMLERKFNSMWQLLKSIVIFIYNIHTYKKNPIQAFFRRNHWICFFVEESVKFLNSFAFSKVIPLKSSIFVFTEKVLRKGLKNTNRHKPLKFVSFLSKWDKYFVLSVNYRHADFFFLFLKSVIFLKYRRPGYF